MNTVAKNLSVSVTASWHLSVSLAAEINDFQSIEHVVGPSRRHHVTNGKTGNLTGNCDGDGCVNGRVFTFSRRPCD